MHNRKYQISAPADTENAAGPSSIDALRPDPEVVPIAKRRAFSKAEKLRILSAADACVASGDIAALLRRESLHSSHLATWRKQRQTAGALERQRVPKTDPAAAQTRRVPELENEVERLRATLANAFQRPPTRFKHRMPQPKKLPTAAWINPPLMAKKAA